MNQILVTKKLYITPELKRKKKIYKFDFFLSIFLLCILISVAIYAEYDRNKGEEVSQEILANLDIPEDTTIAKNNILVVVLNDDYSVEDNTGNNASKNSELNTQSEKSNTNKKSISPKGYKYETIATINIPKISLTYPILEGETNSVEETEDLLKISPTKFWGSNPNEVGNFCIVGHNYRNTRFFSKVPTLENGDIIEITSLIGETSGKTIKYRVYNMYEVEPTDVNCTSQLTNGQKEITLITCTDDSKHRVIVKARELK